MHTKFISIKGAREHNLKNINVDIPKNNLVVITGLSGSGKSSLAFDTIYVEGQRKYMESLSSYVRQFLHMYAKPDLDSITGVSPTIAINQKSIVKNVRSTVATITEIYDYLRVLFARIGTPYSPSTGKVIRKYSPHQIANEILKLPEGAKFYIMAEASNTPLDNLIKKGYSRFKINGKIYDTSDDDINSIVTSKATFNGQNGRKGASYYVIIDRLVNRSSKEQPKRDLINNKDNDSNANNANKDNSDFTARLITSIEKALSLGGGQLFIEVLSSDKNDEKILTFSETLKCLESDFTFGEINPKIFSFNTAAGWCPVCKGVGTETVLNIDLFLGKFKNNTFEEAISNFLRSHDISEYSVLYLVKNIAQTHKIALNKPWESFRKAEKNFLLEGDSKNPGLVKILIELLYAEQHYELARDLFFEEKCKACQGYRLKPEIFFIRINEKHIGQITELSIEKALKWFQDLYNNALSAQELAIAELLLKEIISRLSFLQDVGLEYLSLDRNSGTLSGGESQRIRLASQIGSGLTGIIYVLDEPSIGLHQCDNERLIEKLKQLRDLDNTVIVVEHDEDTMLSADYLIDVGPGAGIYGGNIIACGTPEEIRQNALNGSSSSLTGLYLAGKKRIELPEGRRKPEHYLTISGMNINNLKNLEVAFPLRCFTCFTGVSGSGKSSIVNITLCEAVRMALGGIKSTNPQLFFKIEGIEHIDKMIVIDQSPIGRAPFSNPMTYTGVFDLIRDWFANLAESKIRGYKVGRFSFNVKGGRCENCRGYGMIKVEMHILADAYVKCEECQGKRYNRETLEIQYKGKNISDILEMSIDELGTFFEKIPNIKHKIRSLLEVGLGYLRCGQPALYLSGGEAQRVKLAKELAKRSTGKTLYTLDEPTTGLHIEDIAKLLKILHKLVELGNTVVTIEHNLHFIKTADYIIDLGPKGGENGGYIVAKGTPEAVVQNPGSVTGNYLKNLIIQ